MVSAAKLDGRNSCVKLKLQFKQFSGTKTESDALTKFYARFICATTFSAEANLLGRGCPLILMRRPVTSDVAHQMKSHFVEPEQLIWPNHVIILNEESNGDSVKEQCRHNSNKFIFVSFRLKADQKSNFSRAY